MSNENKPHPHAHWIKLWADGFPIEYKAGGKWVKVIQFNTMTMPDIEYRIKPEENEPWKPKEGETFYFVTNFYEEIKTSCAIWNKDSRDVDFSINNNCFRTHAEAEAAAERVKAALKATTDVNANVGSNVGSPEIDGKQMSEGEIALIKALRNVNIYKVYEGDSILVFNDEDDGLQVDGDVIAFGSDGWNDEIRACLKKIKAEQEARNEA